MDKRKSTGNRLYKCSNIFILAYIFTCQSKISYWFMILCLLSWWVSVYLFIGNSKSRFMTFFYIVLLVFIALAAVMYTYVTFIL